MLKCHQMSMNKSSVMEIPQSPFKKGGPPINGSGIKRDGERTCESDRSVTETLGPTERITDCPPFEEIAARFGRTENA